MERPAITEFMGDGFTLNKAHKQYLENLELWNYVQALDAYCDDLEDKLREGEKEPDNESNCNKHGVDARFSSRDELKTFIQMHIPLVVKPTKPAKTMFVSPFRSLNAKDIVIDTLTDALLTKD